MKAMIEKNRRSRILTTVVILTMATAAGYGQGLLAEGAMKLFNALTSKNASEQTIFHQTGYSGQAKSVADREFSPAVIRSFSVEDVEITFEQEVNAEEWMTESFAENVEEGVQVESWMTSSISESLETPVSVETWMTTPITENLEATTAAEAWMTAPLYAGIETAPEVENWMTTPLFGNTTSEEAIQLEAWMTTPLFE